MVIAIHPTDGAKAQTYCAAGGHAAVANAAQLAAFKAAAKPVMDGLLREAQTKTLVDRISEIKASLRSVLTVRREDPTPTSPSYGIQTGDPSLRVYLLDVAGTPVWIQIDKSTVDQILPVLQTMSFAQ